MSLRTPFPIFKSSSDSRVALLQGLMIAALVIGALYLGREVLLPLVVAILLSFVLTPPLIFLRKFKVPRVLGVFVVVTCAFCIILALFWVLSQQATELAQNLPRYQHALSEKITALRKSAQSSGFLEKATDAMRSLEQAAIPDPLPPSNVTPVTEEGKPIPVEIRETELRPLEILREVAGTVLPPLATAGIILLFVIFILLQREDLRDRLIRLAGASDLQRATATMNDAATRLSKYFLRQVLINALYGGYIALGLWFIGVPSPIGWGILAMLMRFVPYVGSFIAAAPPMLLAAVVDPGWTTALIVGALFIVSELVMGQVVEPLVYGHGTGLSPIAVILATIFWTWLWGPLGLLIATPLTVCLAVLGRHIEGLSFLEVLLGDAPALTPAQGFYQRTLIGDVAEATYHAELSLKEGRPLVDYLDEVALEGLELAQHDFERGSLDQERMRRIDTTVKEMMEDLAEFEPRRWFRKVVEKPEASEEQSTGLASLTAVEKGEDEGRLPILTEADLAPGFEVEDAILCIGARTPLDEAAAAMLAGVLDKHGLKARAATTDEISGGNIVALETSKAKLICLSSLGSSASRIRYFVRRLRRVLPEGATILVGCWGEEKGSNALKAIETTAEADAYATSLREAAEICLRAAGGDLPAESEKTATRVA
jgi:predicted PurR-regulated permease PerM